MKLLTRIKLAWFVLTKGGEKMLAMFFAMNIIVGKFTFPRVPNAIKADVKEQLELSGHGHLAVEE